MPELIDRQALIKDMCNNKTDEKCPCYPNCYPCDFSEARRIIDIQPTIEPKCGEWMETEPDEDDRKIGIEFSIKCSRCHDENSHLDFNENHEITGKTFWKSRFCPNCEAYMRGVSGDADD